jgi:hypothetical protein
MLLFLVNVLSNVVPADETALTAVGFRPLTDGGDLEMISVIILTVFGSVLLVYVVLFLIPGFKEELMPLIE